MKIIAETTYICNIDAAKELINETFAEGRVCPEKPYNEYL